MDIQLDKDADIAAIVRALRAATGLNQRPFAERCAESEIRGFNQGSVSHWECGTDTPSVEQFRRMVEVAEGGRRVLEQGVSLLIGMDVTIQGAA